MTLSAGAQLGHYRILEPLGAGGMGEVYRAHDGRLDRDVAIKVLSPRLADDPAMLDRFEREARAVAALTHPNILGIYEFSRDGSVCYAATELLQGESLRQRLMRGPLGARRSMEVAREIARGLAAAHDQGVIHRDLKPENVFLTRDGQVKILDFGLAKITTFDDDPQNAPTAGTQPGIVMGTLAYMSPEQARGRPVDARSDIFSFGAVLYEMLSGVRAFRGDTAADTLMAVLAGEPPELSTTDPTLSPALNRIVRHCLEKDPLLRFQTARDLAFHLESVGGSSVATLEHTPARLARRLRWPAAALALLAAGAALGWLAATAFRPRRPASEASFARLTFRRGTLNGMRFAPDGQTIVYGAAWDGGPAEIFSTRVDGPESRSLGLRDAHLLAVSSRGQMAVLLRPRRLHHYVTRGTLAEVALAGGTPRERAEGVEWADWSPDGADLAVVRTAGGKSRLEYPIGTLLCESGGWISHPRVSPDGQRVAFIDHPLWGNATGELGVVDRAGRRKPLTGETRGLLGLAWSPKGDEVWYTRRRLGIAAAGLDGSQRTVSVQVGLHTLADISREGRALVSQDISRAGQMALAPGQSSERDFSQLDWTVTRAIADDGSLLAFDETADGGGPLSTFYVRRTDASPAVRLGDGIAMALSPDRGWVLSGKAFAHPPELRLVPVGAGQERRLEKDGLSYQQAAFLPDGRHVVVVARAPGQGPRLYVQDLAGTQPPRPISSDDIEAPQAPAVSPDGRFVAAVGPEQRAWIYPLDGVKGYPIPGLEIGEIPIRIAPGGEALYAYDATVMPARIFRLDLATRARTPLRTLMPADGAGVIRISPVLLAPDLKAYAYSYRRILSDLYVVEGLN
jgi:eukaryotic-like serine/threonine-protein kinase